MNKYPKPSPLAHSHNILLSYKTIFVLRTYSITLQAIVLYLVYKGICTLIEWRYLIQYIRCKDMVGHCLPLLVLSVYRHLVIVCLVSLVSFSHSAIIG